MKSWAKIDGALADYVDDNWLREATVKRRLREEAVRLPKVGAFTGYSSLSIAEARALNGKLWCCDVSEDWLPAQGLAGQFDLAFSDAKLKTDERVYLVLFAVGDGMTCALKH